MSFWASDRMSFRIKLFSGHDVHRDGGVQDHEVGGVVDQGVVRPSGSRCRFYKGNEYVWAQGHERVTSEKNIKCQR